MQNANKIEVHERAVVYNPTNQLEHTNTSLYKDVHETKTSTTNNYDERENGSAEAHANNEITEFTSMTTPERSVEELN